MSCQFVVDVNCRERRLVVEVDGRIHDRQWEHDDEREALLAGAGWRMPRVSNTEVQTEVHGVVATIRAALRESLAELPGVADRSPGR